MAASYLSRKQAKTEAGIIATQIKNMNTMTENNIT
jgi:hypothetical protein